MGCQSYELDVLMKMKLSLPPYMQPSNSRIFLRSLSATTCILKLSSSYLKDSAVPTKTQEVLKSWTQTTKCLSDQITTQRVLFILVQREGALPKIKDLLDETQTVLL